MLRIPLAHLGVDAELSEFVEELDRNGSIECRAVINEDYVGVGVGRIQMFKDVRKAQRHCIFH